MFQLPGMPGVQEIANLLPGLRNIRPLKRGGQKLVYSADHNKYGPVVLKLIPDPRSDTRVQREIDVATKHTFANVPVMHTSGFINFKGKQILYLIEHRVQGEPLSDYLTRVTTLPLPTTLAMLNSLLVTTAELEQHNLVHRDIKPDNIMVGQSGEFWLLDFGIARHLDRASLTATNAPFGPHSLGYAAPEQLRNRKGVIDSRADLFSIGVVTYEALSGKHPFLAGAVDELDVVQRTESRQVPPLVIAGDKYGELSWFISSLMEKYLSRRPPNAATALQWFMPIRRKIENC